jgi:hypothetical protein
MDLGSRLLNHGSSGDAYHCGLATGLRKDALHKARWLPQAARTKEALTAALPALLLVKPEEPHHLGSNLPTNESATTRPSKRAFDFSSAAEMSASEAETPDRPHASEPLALDREGCNGFQ